MPARSPPDRAATAPTGASRCVRPDENWQPCKSPMLARKLPATLHRSQLRMQVVPRPVAAADLVGIVRLTRRPGVRLLLFAILLSGPAVAVAAQPTVSGPNAEPLPTRQQPAAPLPTEALP